LVVGKFAPPSSFFAKEEGRGKYHQHREQGNEAIKCKATR